MKDIRKFPICGNPVLPAIYGETLSYAEEMGRVKQGFNDMVDNIEELEDRVEEAEGTVEGFDGRMSTAEQDIDNLEDRADGVDEQIGGIQEQIGNNTLGVSVPKYNADFQDHEYELSGTLASLEDGMVGLVQKACPVPNDNDPSETDPAIIYRAKVHGWDEVKSDISGLQEKLGNNTVKTSVPRYNVQFTDHEYEIVDEHDDIYEGLEDGQVALLQKECATPNDSDPTEKFPELLTTTKVKGWEKVVTDERVWGLTEVEGNPITLEVVQENKAKGTVVKFEPKQNLNGYEYPWAGGANVNKAGFHTGGYVDATGAKVQNSQYGMTDVITLTDKLYLDRGTAEHFGYAIFSDAECTTMTSRGEAGTEVDSIAYNLPSGTTAYALCWWDLGSGVTASQTTMDTAHCEATIGTPASEWTPWANVCPIEGWTELNVKGCGKNMLDTLHTTFKKWRLANNVFTPLADSSTFASYTVNSDQSITLNISNTSYAGIGFFVNACPYDRKFTWNPSTTVVISLYSDYISGAERLVNSSVAITIPANTSGFVTCRVDSPTTITLKPQLELSSKVTPYEAYAESNDITVALGQTVYGGELDVVKSEVKNYYRYIKPVITQIGTVNQYGIRNFIVQYENQYVANTTASLYEKNICTHLQRQTSGFNQTRTEGFLIQTIGTTTTIFIRLEESRCSTIEEANDFINENDIHFCYLLKTPTVITGLTPNQISLLEGVNTLWTDGTNLDVLYVSDIATIKQLNDKLADTIGDIAGTEYVTATSNHAVNDFIIFNGGFYKVISAITAGDTLVVGTNIRKTTVGAEITAILNANSSRELVTDTVAKEVAKEEAEAGTREE